MNIGQNQSYDFFVTYALDDRDWAEGVIVDALRSNGKTCFTREDFEAGKPLLDAYAEAVTSSRKVIIVLSPAYLVDEFARVSDKLARHYGTELGTWPVVALIYKPVEEIPLGIRMLNPIDATREQDWISIVDQLAGQVSLPPREIPAPPYPGLLAYSEVEKQYFFGREAEIQDLLKLLHAYNFLAVIGSSGSGKSSLVKAGLIPALHDSRIFGRGGWLVRDFRPGAAPWTSLTNALAGDPLKPDETVSTLLKEHGGCERLLLVVDQFEELFTVAGEHVIEFQQALLGLIKHEQVYLLITARADFYPSLMKSLLWEQIRANRYELLPLGEAALSAAIRKPAEKVGVYVEAALVERLVSDAGDEPGVLPFIQVTMTLLWDKIVRRFLPLSAYDALILPRSAYDRNQPHGTTGLDAAIAIHADGVLKRLDGEQKEIARRILLRLVNFGEGRPDTRRQQSRSSFHLRYDPGLIDGTVRALSDRKARLLMVSGTEGEADYKIDISHEALITAPSMIRTWIQDGRADEILRRKLQEDAEVWLLSKDASYLYENSRLKQAQEWAGRFHEDISQPIQDFLDASARRERRRRLQRRAFLVLVNMFALFGVASIAFLTRLELLKQAARGPMVSYPAGPAVLGYGDTRVKSELAAFKLDQFEVSNRQYDLCVQANRCTPANIPFTEGEAMPGGELPVTYVTAFQAAAFCDWIGRRLPTVPEWERAVRGPEGRTWPWGEASPVEPSPRVHIFLSEWAEAQPLEGPVAVNDPAFEGGTTADGAWHLLGNVSEWTSSFASVSTCPDPYGKECKVWDGASTEVQALNQVGLGWSEDLLSDEMERVSEYMPASPIDTDPALGFRCAE